MWKFNHRLVSVHSYFYLIGEMCVIPATNQLDLHVCGTSRGIFVLIVQPRSTRSSAPTSPPMSLPTSPRTFAHKSKCSYEDKEISRTLVEKSNRRFKVSPRLITVHRFFPCKYSEDRAVELAPLLSTPNKSARQNDVPRECAAASQPTPPSRGP
jgi:hypothetical protein